MSPRTSSTLGAGVFLAAVGAILTYAVTATVGGLDIDTVGVILMIAGAAMVLIGVVLGVSDKQVGERHVVERRDARGDVVTRDETVH